MVTDIKHGNLYDVCVLCMLFVVPSTATLWQTLLVHYGEHIGSCTAVRLFQVIIRCSVSLSCCFHQLCHFSARCTRIKRHMVLNVGGGGGGGYKYASCDIT